MITIQEFAQKLNGRERRKEITKEEAEEAKQLGFVVMFGASDDLFELRGAIYNEFGAWDGNEFLFYKGKCLNSIADEKEIDVEEIQELLSEFEIYNFAKVKAIWCPKGLECSWVIEPVGIPFASFDIVEDGDLFCRGAVVDIKDLGGESD